MKGEKAYYSRFGHEGHFSMPFFIFRAFAEEFYRGP